MSDWKKQYGDKLTDAAGAARLIKSGDRIWMGQGPEIPYTMLEELYKRKEEYHDVIFLYNVATNPIDMFFDYECKKHFRFISFFNLPLDRMMGEVGTLEYHSCGYDHLDDGIFAYDCNTVAMHVCPPDENGYCNFGHYGISTSTLVINDPRVKKKIGFIDATGLYSVPGDYKDVAIHISEFDAIIEENTETVEIMPSAPSQTDKLIAAQIRPYIKSGDKIQVGWGGLGEEILSSLKECSPLEVYAEIAVEQMMELVKEGVLSKVLASSPGACSADFFDFMSRDNRIRLLPRDRMIELFEVAKQENIVAINVTLMVDLLGQACSEAIGLQPYTGAGGSFAYIYGAMRAPGGRSFLCLRSTHKGADGELASSIVPWLPEGSIVTTPKNAQMYIVSEWGVADVYLKTMRDRIRAIIMIAHPDFREKLRENILTTPIVREDDLADLEL